MGYESRLYIVKKTSIDEDGMTYAMKIAMFDICSCPCIKNVMTKKTNCYFYSDDGETKILADKYGEPLTEATPDILIDVLETEIENGKTYRRIFPLLAMLKSFEEQRKAGVWGDLVVLHYGY